MVAISKEAWLRTMETPGRMSPRSEGVAVSSCFPTTRLSPDGSELSATMIKETAHDTLTEKRTFTRAKSQAQLRRSKATRTAAGATSSPRK